MHGWDRRGLAALALCPAEGLPLSQPTRMTRRYDGQSVGLLTDSSVCMCLQRSDAPSCCKHGCNAVRVRSNNSSRSSGS